MFWWGRKVTSRSRPCKNCCSLRARPIDLYAFVMQGLDLLGGRPRLAAQELEKQRCISQHNSN